MNLFYISFCSCGFMSAGILPTHGTRGERDKPAAKVAMPGLHLEDKMLDLLAQ